jgi:xylulokinase
MKQHLLGIDVGSSSVKACLLELPGDKVVAAATVPAEEMEILSPSPGWAEQDPRTWWQCVTEVTRKVLRDSGAPPSSVIAMGVTYQMHGLVIVDKSLEPVRPAIIWCDSRAVSIGRQAEKELGDSYLWQHLLNSPGNFTASKLRWVKENEPQIYWKIYKAMLPGDYIALKMTGAVTTTASGLTEGTLWDFNKGGIAEQLLSYLDIDASLLPEVVPTFGVQGKLTSTAAAELGLAPGTPLCYRAGDQPNNAFALKALNPGEVAATAGTSGVIYAVTDKFVADTQSRVNTFLHVTHAASRPRLGVLLCVNGTGIMNYWLRKNLFGSSLTYEQMNALANQSPIGAEGLSVLPFGNGAERMLGNRDLGASFHGLNLVRHQPAHLCRAVQEGVAFALGYGFELLQQLGIRPRTIRAGRTNMFQSEVFCATFAQVTGAELELFNTDGAQGAARGAGLGVGHYASEAEAFDSIERVGNYSPNHPSAPEVKAAFERWKLILRMNSE